MAKMNVFRGPAFKDRGKAPLTKVYLALTQTKRAASVKKAAKAVPVEMCTKVRATILAKARESRIPIRVVNKYWACTKGSTTQSRLNEIAKKAGINPIKVGIVRSSVLEKARQRGIPLDEVRRHWSSTTGANAQIRLTKISRMVRIAEPPQQQPLNGEDAIMRARLDAEQRMDELRVWIMKMLGQQKSS
eukprot:GILJ01036774.1.p1 GENE.GILJ01036774.1~~GILJ01036774.1.p1  ORF type:complete len:197 (+),score=19.32 GILJ01036774.1:27-593(+)